MNALAQWLKGKHKARGAFAAEVGLSPSYISQLCADPPTYWPSRDVAIRIRQATDNAVTPNDFLPEYEPGTPQAHEGAE